MDSELIPDAHQSVLQNCLTHHSQSLHSSYHLYTCPLLLLYTFYLLISSPTPPISILLAPYHTFSLDPQAQCASSFFCFCTFPSSTSTQRLAPLSISPAKTQTAHC